MYLLCYSSYFVPLPPLPNPLLSSALFLPPAALPPVHPFSSRDSPTPYPTLSHHPLVSPPSPTRPCSGLKGLGRGVGTAGRFRDTVAGASGLSHERGCPRTPGHRSRRTRGTGGGGRRVLPPQLERVRLERPSRARPKDITHKAPRGRRSEEHKSEVQSRA